MEITALLIRAVDGRAEQSTRGTNWRERFVFSWAGFRGAVSLAAALAVPLSTRSGAAFPDRHLIVFVVSAVILVTVLVQGSTLPAVVRWARMPDDTAHADELQLARRRSAEAALDALPVIARQVGVSQEILSRLRKEYEEHAALVTAGAGTATGSDMAERSDLVRRVRLGVLEQRRRAVTDLRDRNLIDDIVLRELQSAMDLEEVRLLDPADTG